MMPKVERIDTARMDRLERVALERHNEVLEKLDGIIDLWGVHLTGVSDLPPRAARQSSLQAGRMSALPRRLWRNSVWALVHNNVLVTKQPGATASSRTR